jgi:hypothetical protein
MGLGLGVSRMNTGNGGGAAPPPPSALLDEAGLSLLDESAAILLAE